MAQTTSPSAELEISSSAGNSSEVAPRGKVGGEGKLPFFLVSFGGSTEMVSLMIDRIGYCIDQYRQ